MEELFLISGVAVFIIGLIGIKSRHYILKLSQRAWKQRKQQTAYIKESEKLQQLSVSTPIEQQNYERLRKELDVSHNEWYHTEKRYMNNVFKWILIVAFFSLLACISTLIIF
jgi:hypothetical protein